MNRPEFFKVHLVTAVENVKISVIVIYGSYSCLTSGVTKVTILPKNIIAVRNVTVNVAGSR